MKKYLCLALALVLTVFALTGCRRKKNEMTQPTTVPPTTMAPTTRPTTAPTTAPTTMPTTAPTTMPSTDPGMDDMIPGPEDTIDPNSGANETTGARTRPMPAK